MAKRYDPIMCMMVDEPTKAQDAMPSDLKKAGYEVGTVEKYGSTYYTLVYNGKVISTSPTEANIVEKAKKHYANRHGKVQDGILFYQLRFSSGRTEGAKLDESEIRSYAEALLEKYGEKQVAVSRQGKIIATYLNAKARDVASATQRYINTIVGESKANAEKFVRQAEQDDEVPENELKYVYKAYNDKFGYKFHDSASTLDKAITTADGATGDKLYADVKAIYSIFSNILLTYSNEQSVQKLANEGTKKFLELAAKVKNL